MLLTPSNTPEFSPIENLFGYVKKKLIDLNYAYVIFGKNNVYKDNFKFILEETNKTFKKINSYT